MSDAKVGGRYTPLPQAQSPEAPPASPGQSAGGRSVSVLDSKASPRPAAEPAAPANPRDKQSPRPLSPKVTKQLQQDSKFREFRNDYRMGFNLLSGAATEFLENLEPVGFVGMSALGKLSMKLNNFHDAFIYHDNASKILLPKEMREEFESIQRDLIDFTKDKVGIQKSDENRIKEIYARVEKSIKSINNYADHILDEEATLERYQSMTNLEKLRRIVEGRTDLSIQRQIDLLESSKKDHSSENINFILEAHKAMLLPPSQRGQAYINILNEFIKPDAKQNVNIPSNMRENVTSAIETLESAISSAKNEQDFNALTERLKSSDELMSKIFEEILILAEENTYRRYIQNYPN